MYNFKQKTINVSTELYDKVQNALLPHTGRCTWKDVDKNLEEDLCRAFFTDGTNTANVSSAPKDEDIKFDVDCYVNGHAVQVKCRKNDHLYLEDGKTRNFKKLPGWLDRSLAEFYLFVYPNGPNVLTGRFIKGADLKRLLHIYRLNEKKETLLPEDVEFTKGFGGLSAYVYHKEVIDNETGDGRGSWFEVVL